LSPDELAKFRDWFEQFEGARLDKKIEQHATAGRLDQLAELTLADFRNGCARELWGISSARHSGMHIPSFRTPRTTQ
jgi:hypothetical protein